MSNIVYDYIVEYIRGLLPPRDEFLRQLEQEAEREETYVPIAEPETAAFLLFLAGLTKPRKILEIGTGMGYTSIRLAKGTDAEIITIERYSRAAERARANFLAAGVKGKITLLEGEAVDILPDLEAGFDLIFLDAAKGQYLDFLPQCIRLLNPGGLLFSDNVLYKGMTANNTLVIRRKITIVKRLRRYLREIMQNDELESAIIPIGDGVALSYKKVVSHEKG